jgi:kinetochore protein Spc25
MTVLRLPQIDLTTILAQQNPQIDLKQHAYEISTRNFLKALSSYKNRAITVITARRNNQAVDKKRVSERIQAIKAETNQYKVREIELVSGMHPTRWPVSL